jgi:uncharacterized membrane protein YgaE (UPF0421/DUF939 family)
VKLPTNLRAPTRVPILQVTKTAIAMIAAWFIALAFLPTEIPIFAAVSALLVVQPSVNQSVGRAVERSLGVIVGVVVAYGIGLAFGRSSWIVLLAVVVAIFLAWALKLTTSTANQVPITAMLVLSIGAQTPDYAFARIVETILGAAIGIIVNLVIVPPVLLAPAHQRVVRLANEVSATIERLAAALRSRQTPAQLEELLITARLLRPMQQKAGAALEQGEESLTLNPRRSRNRTVLEADAALYERLVPIVTRVIGMTRAIHDHYDDSLAGQENVQAIASELSREAHDLRLLTRGPRRASEPAPTTDQLPVLTAPISIQAPDPKHWILLGSLMEDVRRIRETIVAEDPHSG